jgi:hypothetical protein
MTTTEATITQFPVEPLEDLYASRGSKDETARAAIWQLVQGLVEFGVSPADVAHHLTEEAKKVN